MTSLQDLVASYRKAKVDLYYSSSVPIFAIADYEENIEERLEVLLDKINGEDELWVNDEEFLGTWSVAEKSINFQNIKKDEFSGDLIVSSPKERWTRDCKDFSVVGGKGRPCTEFRVMANCSLDFHVFSTLWMLKVGHKYEAKLGKCAYGNRLRRTQDGKNVNLHSLGTFIPYLKPFRDWRDNGISAMRSALGEKKDIIAITADVSSFYHQLNPGFMLSPKYFCDVMGLIFSEEEEKINRLFVRALEAWAQNTPLKRGLPVGLPASAVVANVALIELDRLIEEKLAPLYYGRYVDDIILVMSDGEKFKSKSELWEWIFARMDGRLSWAKRDNSRTVRFNAEYFLEGNLRSNIRFSNEKNKVFSLSGETGQTLIDSIALQIHERASEWRAMPRLPRSASHVGTDLIAATQSDGEAADNLRKADALTMRRAGFAIKLRDFEAYERDLHPDAWKEHRVAFLDAFIAHVLVLPNFFTLAAYLPRVVRLTTACEDFNHLRKIIIGIEYICSSVAKHCDIKINSITKKCDEDCSAEVQEKWKRRLFGMVGESVVAAFPLRLSDQGKRAWEKASSDLRRCSRNGILSDLFFSRKGLKRQYARLFACDLAHVPLRFSGLPKEMVGQRGIIDAKKIEGRSNFDRLLPNVICSGIYLLAGWLKIENNIPSGMVFATRPFNLIELYFIAKSPFDLNGRDDFQAVIMALRGFKTNERMPVFDRKGVLQIPDGGSQGKQRIAVSSWKTCYESWVASVTGFPDPDGERYSRINSLLDELISQPRGVRYFILPELALPAHWFIRVAKKLQGRGISLITGVEYLHPNKKHVRNQVWTALIHDGLGFPSLMIYRQDKQRPALHEEQDLRRLAGLELLPDNAWEKPPIIQHGGFRFALLVCSELTNIGYRADLRGKVDALFVPEWNQDTETFNALIESAALDIHAYIIQCNDRQYGDSRIRSPAKDGWMRDLLRVKGGLVDYCVIGEIDVHALRRFQTSFRSSSGGKFKPVPDGFKIAKSRKMLPWDS